MAALALCVLCGSHALGVQLRGEIVRVGFSGSSYDMRAYSGADHYRVGTWVPILVDLTNDDGGRFDGRLEVRQVDRDGDEAIAVRDITLRDSGRFYIYAPGGLYRADEQFSVRILSDKGELVTVTNSDGNKVTKLTPPRNIIPCPPENRVILDISERPVNALGRLINDELLQRGLIVTRASAAGIPDNVAGLAMIDTIVWDDPDPSQLRDTGPQLQAIIEWCQRGGTLVLGVGRNWELVARNDLLGDLLPARLTSTSGVPHTATLSGELNELIFGEAKPDRPLDPPLIICPVTVKDLAYDATPVVPDRPGSEERIAIARRACGRGAIVLVTAKLEDLLAQVPQGHPEYRDALLREALRVRLIRRPEAGSGVYGQSNLFNNIERMVGFQGVAFGYFFIAFLFVCSYIVFVTFGSWSWLKRSQRQRHAWLTFAVLTIVCCGASLGAVRVIRGLGVDVQEFSVVDARAGSDRAAAKCYFGLKTASHAEFDLTVPVDWNDPENSPTVRAAILPLGADSEAGTQSVYSAARRYFVDPANGILHDVPFRATLKQFEAHWQGNMPGRITGNLRRIAPGETALTDNSHVENQLGSDLTNCCLIVADQTFDQRAHRPNRPFRIHHYDLGTLRDGQRIYINSVLDPPPGSSAPRKAPTRLEDMMKAWIRTFAGSQHLFMQEDEEQLKLDRKAQQSRLISAMMLMSLYDESDPAEFAERGSSLRRSFGTDLECSLDLTRDTAMFIGFSNSPGPARICYRDAGSKRRFLPVEPDDAIVMYRIAVPVLGD